MNMIRNILTVALAALGAALWFIPDENSDNWKWLNIFGSQAGHAFFVGPAVLHHHFPRHRPCSLHDPQAVLELLQKWPRAA